MLIDKLSTKKYCKGTNPLPQKPMSQIQETNKIWQKVLGSLEVDVSPAVFSTFLKPTKAESFENSIITVLTKDHYQKENLETRYYAQIKAALDDITNSKNEIIFKVGLQKEEKKPQEQELGPLFKNEEISAEEINKKIKTAGLAPFYTFENYMVGGNNQVARAIAQAISDNPGQMYNPLFIYSGVGLGKTHLIQAIGNEIIKKHTNLKVLYCTGESFMNELLEAITEGRKQTFLFRKKFRASDVLIIDDVQFIAGRESTQEEFFNTFNTLYQDKRQVILASDRPPKEIPKLEERLSSRFAAGMIARIDPPDLEMRIALLRRKREATGFLIPDEALEAIARTINTNIRELEGAFLQTVSHAGALGKEITKSGVYEALGKNETQLATLTPKDVIRNVSRHYNVMVKDLKGKSRKADIAWARQVCMYLLRNECNMALESVGELLGGRDHTTIMHGTEKVRQRIDQDKEFTNLVKELTAIGV